MSTFILPLLEQAAANFLNAQTFAVTDEDGINIDSTRIYKGFQRTATVGEEGQMFLPSVTVSSMNAVSSELYSGDWVADLVVTVKSKVFDTSDLKHQLMAEEVFALFFDSDIALDLSGALANFTASLVVPRQQSRAVENNCWVSMARFEVRCCGSDIAIN